MGCYFYFRSGKNTLRVDLQDIAMKAPMREGRPRPRRGQIVPYAATGINSSQAQWNSSDELMNTNTQSDPFVLRRYFGAGGEEPPPACRAHRA